MIYWRLGRWLTEIYGESCEDENGGLQRRAEEIATRPTQPPRTSIHSRLCWRSQRNRDHDFFARFRSRDRHTVRPTKPFAADEGDDIATRPRCLTRVTDAPRLDKRLPR